MRYPQLTKEQLERDMEAPEKRFYELFPNYPHEGLAEEDCELIWRSSIKREVFEIWHDFHQNRLDHNSAQKYLDENTRYAAEIHSIQSIAVHEPYLKMITVTPVHQNAIDALDAYAHKLGASLLLLTDIVLQPKLADEFFNSYERYVLENWMNTESLPDPDNEEEIEEALKEFHAGHCVLPFLTMTSLFYLYNFKAMEAFKAQYSTDMTFQDYRDIQSEMLKIFMATSIKNRSEGNQDILEFLFSGDNLVFTRNTNGKLCFQRRETNEDEIAYILEHHAQPGHRREIADKDRTHMGCPVVGSRIMDDQNTERSFFAFYLGECSRLFKEAFFSEPHPSQESRAEEALQCPFQHAPA